MRADEHGHESARVEAHEYEEKGGIDKCMRESNELRRVNGMLMVLSQSVTYRSKASYRR